MRRYRYKNGLERGSYMKMFAGGGLSLIGDLKKEKGLDKKEVEKK